MMILSCASLSIAMMIMISEYISLFILFNVIATKPSALNQHTMSVYLACTVANMLVL